jgi:hypothetical protein
MDLKVCVEICLNGGTRLTKEREEKKRREERSVAFVANNNNNKKLKYLVTI